MHDSSIGQEHDHRTGVADSPGNQVRQPLADRLVSLKLIAAPLVTFKVVDSSRMEATSPDSRSPAGEDQCLVSKPTSALQMNRVQAHTRPDVATSAPPPVTAQQARQTIERITDRGRAVPESMEKNSCANACHKPAWQRIEPELLLPHEAHHSQPCQSKRAWLRLLSEHMDRVKVTCNRLLTPCRTVIRSAKADKIEGDEKIEGSYSRDGANCACSDPQSEGLSAEQAAERGCYVKGYARR